MGDELTTGPKLVREEEYFTTLEITQRLDLIHHLIENSEIIPLVRGHKGAGKSQFASQVQRLAPDNWKLCLFKGHSSMSPDRLMSHIARCMEWAELQGEQLEVLIKSFEIIRHEGQVPVLLIDDAQLVPPSSLIAVFRLFERQYEDSPLVSVVLFADEQIDSLLAAPQLQIMMPQKIQLIDLPLLSREDATEYMLFIMRMERLPADVQFDDTKLTKLYRETRGNPGLLKQAILELLCRAGELPSRQMPQSVYWLSIITVGLLLFAFYFILLDPFDQDARTTPTAETDDPFPELSGRQELQQTTDLHAQQFTTHSEVIVDTAMLSTSTNTKDDQAILSGALEQSNIDSTTQPSRHEFYNQVRNKQSEAQLKFSLLRIQDDSDVHDHVNDDENRLLDANILNSQLPQEIVSNSTVATGNTLPIKGSETVPGFEQGLEAHTQVIEDEDRLNENFELLGKEAWILARPNGHFTLQLLGVENLKALEKFVRQYNLTAQAFYIETQRNGKPWYPLLWGDFPDKKSAIKASGELPQEVQKSGYWPRPFAALKQEIKRSRE
jgi:DamX protein